MCNEVKKYRKKPVIIEAIQWDGSYESYKEIKKCFSDLITTSINYHEKYNKVYFWKIFTLEGGHEVSPGDYIVKGVKGEYYPVKPDIFRETYEGVESA